MSLLSRLAVQAARAYGMLARTGAPTNVSASYLVVAGGASGGILGGGGAGGLLTSTATLSTLNTYSITVGAGGAGTTAQQGNSGSNSSVSGLGLTTITSSGGGGGGGNGTKNGVTGGSGGGAGYDTGVGGTPGSGTLGQGNAGGNGAGNAGGTAFAGGGGGGASAVGSNAVANSTGGNGGAGSASSISGSSVTYAGGGGGGTYLSGSTGTNGTGGAGGGGAGGKNGTNATAGTPNTGGGGGGNGLTSAGSAQGSSGAGGSGIVIISYTSATPKFVGGTLTTSGGNQIHTFTSSGTLSPLTPVTASYLVVAGGGGGGYDQGGGGGAGGYQTSSTTLYLGATYIVTVGAGGAGATTNQGTSGSNSVLSGTGLTTLTSTGGGGGGGDTTRAGLAGGSGGGTCGVPSSSTGGAGTSGQGNNGGTSSASPSAGSGGGGAGAVGSSNSGYFGGAGGIGLASSISGTSTYYAGGGGGGANGTGGSTGGAGGNGGGGAGASGSGATTGTTNTGGGGGGGYGLTTPNRNGAAGGSGIVIISYAGSQVFNGGLVTSSGGNTIHTFTATGALTPLTNNLNNSLRFRGSASAYLSRTPTLAGSTTVGTFSNWLKLGAISTDRMIYHVAGTSGNNNRFYITFNADNTFQAVGYNSSGSVVLNLNTTQVFRDPSAWYHIVVAIDTTQATSSNRAKMYVNGNQITAFGTATYPSQNQALGFTNNTSTLIASNQGVANLFDGYMTDINFIDGQALEPYYFGNNDANGVWKPIKYTGMYGTNGFYLTFGNTTSTTTLGYDSSGNGNNWTTNNISLTAGTTYDAMLDVPTNTSATVANYAVLNPLMSGAPFQTNAAATVSQGNLQVDWTTTGQGSILSTIAMTSGKWYFEGTVTGTNTREVIGIVNSSAATTTYVGGDANGWGYFSVNGQKYNNGSATSYGATYTTNDIIGVAFDADAGSLTFYKNGTSQGTAFTGLSAGTYFFAVADANSSLTCGWNVNFGQRPFSYTPPTGYVALNTYNLSTPTILQGNKYMDATLYTGNGSTQVVVNNAQFKPDLVWLKARSINYSHYLYDSVRGALNTLNSNGTGAETSYANSLTSFNSNGFSLGSAGGTNESPNTMVGWQWQAGQGSTSTNTSGNVTSTVSVSTTAGFSIVTYTGGGSSGNTVGHGLSSTPAMVIVKNRTNSGHSWAVRHISLTSTQNIALQNTDGAYTVSSATSNGGIGTLTSTTFSFISGTVGLLNVNASSNNYVAYCWAAIAGFSAFGSYTGNGSADGPFVYTGFRPKFVLIKRTDAVTSWFIHDTSRDTYNTTVLNLYPNLSAAEETQTTYSFDILSNGFKVRGTSTEINASSGTYIYAAYAENPFKNSNAR